jgi:dTDP-4-dehydrorhamnose 3,5-epimerase
MSFPYNEPTVIKGGVAVDDRGSVRFINDFNFNGVKRFYMIENHETNFVRAWHGHKNEGKYFLCTKGSFLCGAVKVDDWAHPSKDLKAQRLVLSSQSPSILAIPPGYANGLMSLAPESQLMVFSSSTLDQSLNDDIRFPARFWDIWSVEER